MTDVLYRDIEWSHVARLPVLGVMTTFETNSSAVFDIVREVYGAWADLATNRDVVSPSDATVRIVVHDRPTEPESAPVFSCRVPDPTRLVIVWDGGAGIADAERMESLAYVTEDLLSRRLEFVEEVLEPLTLSLLNALDRQPVHAAAVAREDTAIILAGPSGVGKSTLTYAAYRRGFSLLADEPVYVQTRPTLRVWGRRPRIHLRAEARTYFPELRDRAATRLPSGKRKIVVDARDRARRYAERTAICLLRRASGDRPSLEPVVPEDVVAELGTELEPGFDLFEDTIGERLSKLAERGAWHLHLAGSPDDAVPLLDEVVAELERGR